MKHLGDVTKIDGHIALVVDVVIGGSPCQDLSFAGKREELMSEGKRKRYDAFCEKCRVYKGEMQKRTVWEVAV